MSNLLPVSAVNSQTLRAAEARVGVTREPVLPNSEPRYLQTSSLLI